MFSASGWFTSAIDNDRVWHVCAARAVALAHDLEGCLDARLVVIGPHVLLDFYLDAIATWAQARCVECAADPKRARRQAARPVAVDVHVAREEGSVVTANGDDEDRFEKLPQGCAFDMDPERLVAADALRR